MKHTNQKIIVTMLLLAASFWLLTGKQASAQSAGLGVFPPVIQIEANPPTSFSTTLVIENLSTNTQVLNPSFKPFTQAGSNNGVVSYLPTNTPFGPDTQILKKIHLTDNGKQITTLTLSPKQQKKLTLSVSLPKDEPLSDYYFSLVFTSQVQDSVAKNNTQVPIGIATNILLSVGPKGAAQATIDSFSAPGFVTHGPVPFTVLVRNTGEHVIATSGEIDITNMFGQLIGKVDLTPVNILKKTSRYIPDATQTAIDTRPVAMWPTNILLGPYTAKLRLFVTAQGPEITKTVHFFALPWPVIIGAFFAILFAMIIAERVQKHIREKE